MRFFESGKETPHTAYPAQGFKFSVRKIGRRYWMFERRMMERVMPYREKMFSKAYHKASAKAPCMPEHEKREKLEAGLKKAKKYSVADLSLESLNFLVLGFSGFNLAGAFGAHVDSLIQKATSWVGVSMHDNAPKWALVFACAALSKIIVKIGCWVETFQMIHLESLARKTGFIHERGVGRILKRYSHESIVEQIKDAIIVLIPIPFFDFLRRRSAIASELRQLHYIRNLEKLILKKKEPVAESIITDKPNGN